jgi:hypothetical protein
MLGETWYLIAWYALDTCLVCYFIPRNSYFIHAWYVISYYAVSKHDTCLVCYFMLGMLFHDISTCLVACLVCYFMTFRHMLGNICEVSDTGDSKDTEPLSIWC